MVDTEQDVSNSFDSGSDRLPCFNIGDVSDSTGISAFTIRYYDKCGFFPDLARDHRGVRAFSSADIQQLLFVDALRKSGLSIEGIQYYVKLQQSGESTREERFSVVRRQETNLEYQLAELEECMRRLRIASMELSAKEEDVH